MLEAYEEYFEAAKAAMRPGSTCHDVHRAVALGFTSAATTSGTSPGTRSG